MGRKFQWQFEKFFDIAREFCLNLANGNMKAANIKTTMTPMAGYVVSSWQRHSCLFGIAGISS
jgi:hypothetical protein